MFFICIMKYDLYSIYLKYVVSSNVNENFYFCELGIVFRGYDYTIVLEE